MDSFTNGETKPVSVREIGNAYDKMVRLMESHIKQLRYSFIGIHIVKDGRYMDSEYALHVGPGLYEKLMNLPEAGEKDVGLKK